MVCSKSDFDFAKDTYNSHESLSQNSAIWLNNLQLPVCGVIHTFRVYIDGVVQERGDSIVNALELRLSCTNPSIWKQVDQYSL